MTSEELVDFVQRHKDEEPQKLLLQRDRFPEVDMSLVAQQIEGQRQASTKWPTLAGCGQYLYPPRLNREQSSSEETARLKRRIAAALFDGRPQIAVADLTGGMGIDSLALAGAFDDGTAHSPEAHVDYCEQTESLCRLMEHNIEALGVANIGVHCVDSIDWLARSGQRYDLLYADPARRDGQGRKVAAFEACQPDLLRHAEQLKEWADWLLVKASPMLDIDLGASQLGRVRAVHIVAVNNECKELLFVCGPGTGEPTLHCHSIVKGHETSLFSFTRSEEAAAESEFCNSVGTYLYEPDASLMKGGPYRLLGQRNRLAKLAPNTHLYTAERLTDWSGRVFRVLEEVKLNRRAIAQAIPEGRAHVMTRNYPVEAAELQRRLGLHEGGTLTVVATTVGGERRGYLCQAV